MKLRPLVGLLLLSLSLGWAGCAPPPPPAPAVLPTNTPPPTEPAPATVAARPSPPPAASATPTPGPVELVVWESLPAAQAGLLAAEVEEFSAAWPNVTVRLQHYESPDDFLAAGEAGPPEFDLVLGPQSLVARLQAGDELAPLDELFAGEFLADFVEPALAGARLDDHLWGLPASAGFHLLLFYNPELVPEPPATTQALFDLAASLTRDGRWGLALNSFEPLWVVPWLGAYGGWLTDAQGAPDLDSQAMVQALTLVLKWQGRLAGVAPVASYPEAREMFLNGRAAMLIDGEWAIAEMGQAEGVGWAVAPLPALGSASQPARPLVLARYWAVRRPESDAHAQAAAALLEFLTDPARQLVWAERFGLLPTRSSALSDPQIENDPVWQASARQLLAGRGVPLDVDPDRLLQAMRPPLRAMLEGRLTPREAAAAMQRALP